MPLKIISVCMLASWLYAHHHAGIKTFTLQYIPLNILKTVSCHDANFVVTGGTVVCYHNLRCQQWRRSRHHKNSVFNDMHTVPCCFVCFDHILAFGGLFSCVLRGRFTDTAANIWLPQCLWNNPKKTMQTVWMIIDNHRISKYNVFNFLPFKYQSVAYVWAKLGH